MAFLAQHWWSRSRLKRLSYARNRFGTRVASFRAPAILAAFATITLTRSASALDKPATASDSGASRSALIRSSSCSILRTAISQDKTWSRHSCLPRRDSSRRAHQWSLARRHECRRGRLRVCSTSALRVRGCVVLHRSDPIAFGVLQITARPHRRNGEFRHRNLAAVGHRRFDGGVDVVHRNGALKAGHASAGHRLTTSAHGPENARALLIAGINQVEPGRAPGFETPSESPLVEFAGARQVVRMDGKKRKVVRHEIEGTRTHESRLAIN